ncbi:SRPBCC family protein [Crateriforma conspicua]|uniref:Bacterial transcription activator, effector binding domain n=1 Tax=Crateriforma conspicua TaxID=2527996 RepID=A0A5C5Y639_9PLAN|nr:GyrI-like domain-containing protein [Crateriforma conspicua]TWT70183.1 Bacterial transcription activator, effector binding domain [Crateriforma conspicua]
MPAFHIQRTHRIAASAEQVFDAIADFRTWTTWSPWLKIDPDPTVTISTDPSSVGSTYDWQGDLVGQGGMKHRWLDRPRKIEIDLHFIKPFKSQSEVRFDIRSVGDETEVTWHMIGKLPWFLFWMKSSMEMFVGMDYERGLQMLAEYVKTGTVTSKLDVQGAQSLDRLRVLGIRESCSMDDIGPVMEKVFEKVHQRIAASGVNVPGNMISVYHPTCDLKTRYFDFTCGIETTDTDVTVDGLDELTVDAGRYLKVRHTGRYQHLGNAWSGAAQYCQYKKLKMAKEPGLEFYPNSPQDTDPADLITDVYMAIKG